jgi:signal transduction histidine kinase
MVLNALVFVLVLGVFSIVVYASVTHNIDSEKRQRLQVLTHALVGSIESPHNEPDEPIPDVVQSHDANNQELSDIAIEWFDANQRLRAKKGLLAVTVPFDKSAEFQTQNVEHALLLTRAVERDGHLIGYLRVSMSLLDSDSYKRNLLVGLGIGTMLALGVSWIAAVWLVRQALKPVEINIRKLTEFTADASHELKNPIMAIKTNGAVALKYSDGMSDTHRKNIEMMLDAANQMSRTIADLLSLAESEHELPEQVLVPVNLAELIGEVSEDLKVLAASKAVEIKQMVDDPTLSLKARKSDLKLILGNVIRNSIAYSKSGASVLISAGQVGNRIQVEIRDTGIGISQEELPKIFDRFWRSDKARSYTSGGNGLGLAIVKSIVESYSGTATVKSKLGEGTSFIITFPYRR